MSFVISSALICAIEFRSSSANRESCAVPTGLLNLFYPTQGLTTPTRAKTARAGDPGTPWANICSAPAGPDPVRFVQPCRPKPSSYTRSKTYLLKLPIRTAVLSGNEILLHLLQLPDRK